LAGRLGLSPAGYGSAGGQPERRASPMGHLPSDRALVSCRHAVRIRQPSRSEPHEALRAAQGLPARQGELLSQTERGSARGAWPAAVAAFLEGFLPLQKPLNYQLVADGMERLCHFKRARSSVEAYVKSHLSHLVPAPQRKPRTYRRFRRARIGELYQHDSSTHQWWPASAKQSLLLTVDDHSGRNVAHLVAPTPQVKGKVERRFGTFPNRMVTLLASAKAATCEHAEEVLQMEIVRQNRTKQRNIGRNPLEVWDKAERKTTADPPRTRLVSAGSALPTPSGSEILGRGPSDKRRLAHDSRHFRPLKSRSVLYWQETRFSTVADSG
jgi:hypothetical protein